MNNGNSLPAHPRTTITLGCALALTSLLDRLLLRPALRAGVDGTAPEWAANILDMVGETAVRALPAYENVATRVTVALAALLIFTIFGARRLRLDRFFGRFVGEARAEVPAFLRIITAVVLFMHVVVEDIAGTALFPDSLVHHHGVFALLAAIPGVEELFGSLAFTTGLELASLLVLACAAIGLGTRVTVPLSALLYLFCAAFIRQPSWSFHLGLIPWYAMAILAFFPTADAYSVDAWLKRRRGEPVDSDPGDLRQQYGWARFAWVAVLTVPYFEAGMSKLCDGGFGWGAAENMRTILYRGSLNEMQFDFDLGLGLAHFPDAFYAFLGVAAVFGEVLMIFTIFTRLGRLVFPAMMFFMHFGIMLTQNILFWDLMVMLAAIYVLPVWDRQGGPWDPRALLDRMRASSSPRATAPAESEVRSPAPRSLVTLAWVGGICWVFAVEFFPLTAMQMFSRPPEPPGVLEYYQMHAETADGQRADLRPDDILPALRAPRYRRGYRFCFSEAKVDVCTDMLDVLTELQHEATDDPSHHVTAWELEHYRWDFGQHPNDENHGEVLRTFRYEPPRQPREQ